VFIIMPRLRHIELVRYGQAGERICNRQAHGNLTICLFPQLPAILMRDADGVFALLGHAAVIDNPSLNRLSVLHLRNHFLTHACQDCVIVPGRRCNEVLQLLVHSWYVLWVQSRTHGFDTFVFPGQHRADQIRAKREYAISMPKSTAQSTNIRVQSSNIITEVVNRSEAICFKDISVFWV